MAQLLTSWWPGSEERGRDRKREVKKDDSREQN